MSIFINHSISCIYEHVILDLQTRKFRFRKASFYKHEYVPSIVIHWSVWWHLEVFEAVDTHQFDLWTG